MNILVHVFWCPSVYIKRHVLIALGTESQMCICSAVLNVAKQLSQVIKNQFTLQQW